MSENDCVFCKIVRREMESEVVHDEEGVMAFRHRPQSAGIRDHSTEGARVFDGGSRGRLPDVVAKRVFEVAHEAVEKFGVAESGYAFRINNGADAGQEVLSARARGGL